MNGANVWVGNGTQILEISDSTGSPIRVISDEADDLNTQAITFSGSHVWVANGIGVTELNEANGSMVRHIETSPAEANVAIAANGPRVWLAAQGWRTNTQSTVTEFNASNGSVVRIISAKSGDLDYPDGIAVDAQHVWVTNKGDGQGGGSVSELNESSGALVKSFSSPSGASQAKPEFNAPDGIAVSHGHVWVANRPMSSTTPGVAELKTTNGALIQMLNSPKDQFDAPCCVAVEGSHVWVANTACNDTNCSQGGVAELRASTGASIRYVEGFRTKNRKTAFREPTQIAANASWVWFASIGGLTELSASTGKVLHNYSVGCAGLVGSCPGHPYNI